MYVKHKDKKKIQSSGPGQVDFPAGQGSRQVIL